MICHGTEICRLTIYPTQALPHLYTGLSMEYAPMWLSSSTSNNAVLGLNSTRPSRRRRRRPRLELQLERLEDRKLLSVPTVSFIKQDTTTQGNWIGTYGSQGY